MFYEKLAQAKEDKKRKGLSGLQMGGIGLAGTAGAGVGAGAMIGAGRYSQRVNDFYYRGTKKERDTVAATRKAYEDVRSKMKGYQDIVRKGDKRDLFELLIWKNLGNDIGKNLENLMHEQDTHNRVFNFDYDSVADPKVREALRLDRPKRLKMSEDLINKYKREIIDKMEGISSAAYDEANAKIDPISKRIKSRRGFILGGSMLGGGLVAGYGAKKLFDRYNARKQERK